MSDALAAPGASPSAHPPADVAAMMYTALSDPKPLTTDFSMDGTLFISTHTDDAIRVAQVEALAPSDVVRCSHFGVHQAVFTHSSAVVAVAPRLPLDGHVHLLNLETAQVVGSLAHVSDAAAAPPPLPNLPAFNTVTQCPRSDVIAATTLLRGGRLLLFHPLVSGAVAATPAGSLAGHKAYAALGEDGRTMLLGDDACVRLFDRRHLTAGPVDVIANTILFSATAASGRGGHCRSSGAELTPDGGAALLTSWRGETVLYDLRARRVARSYYDGVTRRFFAGDNDAPPARFLRPGAAPDQTRVVQQGTTMVGGRHLLVYGATADAEGHVPLEMQLTPRDSDAAVCLSVNRRFALVSCTARSVTWWAFHGPAAGG